MPATLQYAYLVSLPGLWRGISVMAEKPSTAVVQGQVATVLCVCCAESNPRLGFRAEVEHSVSDQGIRRPTDVQ